MIPLARQTPSKACISRMWLCNCDHGQTFEFITPAGNLADDKLLNKGRRTKGCSRMRSSFDGDIDILELAKIDCALVK